MGLRRTTLNRVLNEDFGFRACREKTGHRLYMRLMDLELQRSRDVLNWYAEKEITAKYSFRMKNFLPWDFHGKNLYYKLNEVSDANNSEEASSRIPYDQRGHFPSSLKVLTLIFLLKHVSIISHMLHMTELMTGYNGIH